MQFFVIKRFSILFISSLLYINFHNFYFLYSIFFLISLSNKFRATAGFNQLHPTYRVIIRNTESQSFRFVQSTQRRSSVKLSGGVGRGFTIINVTERTFPRILLQARAHKSVIQDVFSKPLFPKVFQSFQRVKFSDIRYYTL